MLHKLTDRARAATSRFASDVLAVAGAGGVVYGISLVYVPAAWIVGSAAVCAVGVITDRGNA